MCKGKELPSLTPQRHHNWHSLKCKACIKLALRAMLAVPEWARGSRKKASVRAPLQPARGTRSCMLLMGAFLHMRELWEAL